MHGCTQVLHIISSIFGKLDLCFKVTISLKPEFYQMYLRQKRFKIDILIYLKTLPKCQKRKEQKKIGFRGQIVESVEALGQPAQPAKILVDRFPFPDQGRVEECKNTLSLSVAFPSQSRYPHSRSTSGRSSVLSNSNLPKH